MRTNSSTTLRIVKKDTLVHDAKDGILLGVREFALLSICVEEGDKLLYCAEDCSGTNSSAMMRI